MMHVTKYLLGGEGEMLHAFGHKLDGPVLYIRDLANEEYSSFDEVKHAFLDPDFCATAFMLKLERFLADKMKGVGIRTMREADILETSRRLRRIFGLPEPRLPSGAQP